MLPINKTEANTYGLGTDIRIGHFLDRDKLSVRASANEETMLRKQMFHLLRPQEKILGSLGTRVLRRGRQPEVSCFPF